MPRLAAGSVSPERLALAERVRELREQGRERREIMAELGISGQYVNELTHDSDGSKARARKQSYRRPCPGWDGPCGTLMTGSDGRSNGPTLCAECMQAKQHAERYWTREQIISTFRRFAEATGRSPSVSDYWIQVQTPSQVSKYSESRRAERQEPLPTPAIVQREFGSWSAALATAGLERRPSGGAGHRDFGPVEALIMSLPPKGHTSGEFRRLFPDVLKASMITSLNRLWRQGFLEREGAGGARDPFRYWVPR